MPAIRALQPSIYGEYRGAGRPLGRQLDPGMLNPGPVYTYIRTHVFRGLVVGVFGTPSWGWWVRGVGVVGGGAGVGAGVYLRGGGFWFLTGSAGRGTVPFLEVVDWSLERLVVPASGQVRVSPWRDGCLSGCFALCIAGCTAIALP